MFFNIEHLKNFNPDLLESEQKTIKTNETNPVEIKRSYNWAGFKIPDNKKIFFMGQNLTPDALVFYFYNSENVDIDITIYKY
ncbi:hypothetical protein [Bacillus sp. TE8-1]|uniref:hypothetical protein n=1 Tax=Bacillus sp. TE8-1 TaxID=2217829 RepID=UPI0011EDD9DA|nr:hypothetical protein [Bacillus sp. TE8-1]KAA0780903.1 hypothetical protein DN404_00225 [Bacillus sp. TE8-1]